MTGAQKAQLARTVRQSSTSNFRRTALTTDFGIVEEEKKKKLQGTDVNDGKTMDLIVALLTLQCFFSWSFGDMLESCDAGQEQSVGDGRC